MIDLSMHILDIVENSVIAGASRVSIEIEEDNRKGIMSIIITDDGKGMTEEELRRALDPFYTTKKRKRVGLGLPMLNRTAQQCCGSLEIQSHPGRGTQVKAIFMLNHIDCPPLGDINETLRVIVAGNPGVDFDIKFILDGEVEYFSTRKEQADAAEMPLRESVIPTKQT